MSIPGLGAILAPVIAAETGEVRRFARADRFCAYAGLVPSTHASGGRVHHGKLLRACNKWLRWAFVEGAWLAVGRHPYFAALYRHHRARGKNPNVAITAVARRMATIAWHLLNEGRDYTDAPPAPKTISPAAPQCV
jgi:transposase